MSCLPHFQDQNCIAVAIFELILGAILNLKHVKGTIRKIWVCCYPESSFPIDYYEYLVVLMLF